MDRFHSARPDTLLRFPKWGQSLMRVGLRLAWTLMVFSAIPSGILVVAYAILGPNNEADQTRVGMLAAAAWIALIASISLPLLFVALAFMCGNRRWLLSLVLPPLTFFSVLSLAGVLLLQGGLVVGAGWLFLTSRDGGYFGLQFVLPVVLGVLATTFALLAASARSVRPMHIDATGLILRPEDAPRLFEFVHGLATKLRAPPPKQIIIGLEPTFYVTTTPIRVQGDGRQLKEETLYISAPLTRLFSKDEFAAVIGHELGHFRGKDTVYSRRFAPAFAALDRAVASIKGDEDNGPRLLALPALITLGLLYDIFAVNVARVSRVREIEADKAGAFCASAHAAATALLKATWYDLQWDDLLFANTERLARLDIRDNLSAEFLQSMSEQIATSFDINLLLGAGPPHPIDTHPPLSERLTALGFDPVDFGAADVAPSKAGAHTLIEGLEDREAALTVLQHQLLIERRAGALAERDQRLTLVHAAALLGAQLASSEHGRDPAFAGVAEEHGWAVMRDFDIEAFRRFLSAGSNLPDLSVSARIIASLVSDEGRMLLLRYIERLGDANAALAAKVALAKGIWSGGNTPRSI